MLISQNALSSSPKQMHSGAPPAPFDPMLEQQIYAAFEKKLKTPRGWQAFQQAAAPQKMIDALLDELKVLAQPRPGQVSPVALRQWIHAHQRPLSATLAQTIAAPRFISASRSDRVKQLTLAVLKVIQSEQTPPPQNEWKPAVQKAFNTYLKGIAKTGIAQANFTAPMMTWAERWVDIALAPQGEDRLQKLQTSLETGFAPYLYQIGIEPTALSQAAKTFAKSLLQAAATTAPLPREARAEAVERAFLKGLPNYFYETARLSPTMRNILNPVIEAAQQPDGNIDQSLEQIQSTLEKATFGEIDKLAEQHIPLSKPMQTFLRDVFRIVAFTPPLDVSREKAWMASWNQYCDNMITEKLAATGYSPKAKRFLEKMLHTNFCFK